MAEVRSVELPTENAREVVGRQPNPAAAVKDKVAFTPPGSPRVGRRSSGTLNAISGAALARMGAQAARYFGDYKNEKEETGIESITADGIVHPYSTLRTRCRFEDCFVSTCQRVLTPVRRLTHISDQNYICSSRGHHHLYFSSRAGVYNSFSRIVSNND